MCVNEIRRRPSRCPASPSLHTTPSATSGKRSGASRRKLCSATRSVFQMARGRILRLLESFGRGRPQPDRGEQRLHHVRRAQVLSGLGREGVEGPRPLPVLLVPAACRHHAVLLHAVGSEEYSPSRRSRTRTPTAPSVLHPSTSRTISIVQGAPRRPQQVHCAAVAFRAFAFKSDLLRLHHPCRQEGVQGKRVRFIGDLRGPTGLARSASVR